MKPAKFKESNKHLLPPAGMDNCGTLDVFCDGTHCISLWRPTLLERLKIMFTGNIWLWIHSGRTQPPVALDTKFPFTRPKPEHQPLQEGNQF